MYKCVRLYESQYVMATTVKLLGEKRLLKVNDNLNMEMMAAYYNKCLCTEETGRKRVKIHSREKDRILMKPTIRPSTVLLGLRQLPIIPNQSRMYSTLRICQMKYIHSRYLFAHSTNLSLPSTRRKKTQRTYNANKTSQQLLACQQRMR